MTDVRRLTEDEGIGLSEDVVNQRLRLRVRREIVAFLADLANTSRVDRGAGVVGYNSSLQYPAGSVGAALKALFLGGGGTGGSGPWSSVDALLVALQGRLGTAQLNTSLLGTIEQIDAPGTGLVARVDGLAATYGSTASAAASAATASTKQAEAVTAANSATTAAATAGTQAGVATTQATNAGASASAAATSANAASSSAGAAGTSATASQTSRVAAELAANNAGSSASAAASSASAASSSAGAAGTSATASQTSRVAAELAATNAGASASAAATSASTASSSASAAGTSATASQTARVAAETAASNAGTSSTSAATAATTAQGHASAAASHFNNTVAATGPLTASVSELSTAVAGPQGLQAQHVLKVAATRADGKKVFAAIGLAADGTTAAGEGQILLIANQLVFVPADNINAPPQAFLTVGTVDGVTTLVVPAARIGDLTVGTAKLASGAATDVIVSGYENVPVTGLSGTGPQGYGSSFRWTAVGSISYLAQVTGKIVLSVNATVFWTGHSNIFSDRMYCKLKLNCDFAGAAGTPQAGDKFFSTEYAEVTSASADVSSRADISKERRINVTAGTSYVFNFYAQTYETAAMSCTLESLELSIEAIKR